MKRTICSLLVLTLLFSISIPALGLTVIENDTYVISDFRTVTLSDISSMNVAQLNAYIHAAATSSDMQSTENSTSIIHQGGISLSFTPEENIRLILSCIVLLNILSVLTFVSTQIFRNKLTRVRYILITIISSFIFLISIPLFLCLSFFII